MVEDDEQIGWLEFKDKKFDDDLRARGLGSVKTEPRLTQVVNLLKRGASTSEAPHPKLKQMLQEHVHSPHHHA
jgi:hypothetical protein